MVRKRSRNHKVRASGGEVDVLEYLLNAMNDENLPRMQRQAIARKIAPYFHPKLKRVPAAIFASSGVEDPTEEEAENRRAA